MDWTGQHLIRPAKSQTPAKPGRKRVGDDPYIAAHRRGLSGLEAAREIGVSAVAVWKAAKRLGLVFRDGRT